MFEARVLQDIATKVIYYIKESFLIHFQFFSDHRNRSEIKMLLQDDTHIIFVFKYLIR